MENIVKAYQAFPRLFIFNGFDSGEAKEIFEKSELEESAFVLLWINPRGKQELAYYSLSLRIHNDKDNIKQQWRLQHTFEEELKNGMKN